MKVYVLSCNWDWDCPESDILGVFESKEKAKSVMMKEYSEDLVDLDITEDDFEIHENDWGIEIREINDYRYIEYLITEHEIV